MRTLFLKKHEDRRIRAGHLWVFSNEVDVRRSPLTEFAPGEAAELRDAEGRALGAVYVNPASLIAARVVSRRPDEALDTDLIRRRLADALALRERLFAAPFYRLCHGEGDFLPGLVVDRYDDILCVQLTAAGMDARRDDVLEVLRELCRPAGVLLRNDTPASTLEGLALGVEAVGPVPDEIEVLENGARYLVPLAEGQKTGWFYDQRLNRRHAARLAAGKDVRVLDAFCYAGGFGVAAARAGAASVTFLDASAAALAFAARNLERNAPGCAGETVPGDALETLKRLADEGRRFDLVCLDPPAFIKRRKDAAQGLAAYRRVNDLGLRLVEDGGMIVTCSCSHHLAVDDLRRLIASQAAKRGCNVRLLRQGGQGPDHPIHPAMPETAYLKTFTLQVSREGRSTSARVSPC